MLTVDFGRFPVGPGDRVLDLGCGSGRHAYEAYRCGADVVACDADEGELRIVAAMAAAMHKAREAPATDLSTAAIEEIVRRVVAEMSESVVREVAWEVVPDCVERVIEQLTRESLSRRA